MVSRKSRKRQTRLNFTPVPSSSPAAAHLSQDLRNRAAAVDFVGSPSRRKRQKLAKDDSSRAPLPTPADSSQIPHSVRKSKRQQSALNIAPPIKAADNDDESDSDELATASHRSSTFMNSQKQKTRNTPKKLAINQEPAADSTSSDEMPSSHRRKASAGSSARSARTTRSHPSGVASSPLSGSRLTRSSQRTAGSQRIPMTIPEDDESDGLEIVEGPDAGTTKVDVGEAETSGDENLASSPGQKPRGGKRKRAVEEYSEEEPEDSPPVSPVKHRARKTAGSENESEEDEDEDEDEIVASQRTRKLVPPRKRRRDSKEQEDLEEDLEFLRSSPPGDRPSQPNRKLNARQQALEALRRRRAGKSEASDNDNQASSQPRRRAVLSESESDSEEDSDVETDDGGEDDDVVEVARPEYRTIIPDAAASSMFQEDEDDEGFIVEEEEAPLGAPDEEAARLPLQFSGMYSKKPKDLFKYAVEWMVHKKLNPGFDASDEIYELTFRKLNDEVNALAGSKFVSSAWTRDFTRALNARPFIEISEIGRNGLDLLFDHCDACNRRGHPATFDIQFKGKPYRPDDLEEVDYRDPDDSSDEEDSDDSEDAEDRTDLDAQKREIPPQSTVFHVGQFCMRNAQTAHALVHWRFHLYDWVVDYLRHEKYLEPQRIVERDGWRAKKKTKYANKVLDKMVDKGEVDRLWKDFKTEINTARESVQDGGYRGRGRR